MYRAPIRSPFQRKQTTPQPLPVFDFARGFGDMGRLVQELETLKSEFKEKIAEANSLIEASSVKEVATQLTALRDTLVSSLSEATVMLERAQTIQEGKQGEQGPQGVGIMGPQGDPGYTPIKGVDYFDGENGKDGYTPIKGKDYFDGKDGSTIIGPPGPEGRSGKPGKNAPAIDEEGLAERVREGFFSGKHKLETKHVSGLDQTISILRNFVATNKSVRGGGDTVVAGSGVTITRNANGQSVISSTGGFSVLTATGTVNDSNTVFTFVSSPTLVVVNGVSYRHGHGVTIVTTTATLDNPVGVGGDIYGL